MHCIGIVITYISTLFSLSTFIREVLLIKCTCPSACVAGSISLICVNSTLFIIAEEKVTKNFFKVCSGVSPKEREKDLPYFVSNNNELTACENISKQKS